MKNPDGVPAQGASERELHKAWEEAHAKRWRSGREMGPEEVAAANERLYNVMDRCQALWRVVVGQGGVTFTEKRMAIEGAYRKAKEILGSAGIVLVPLAALTPHIADEKNATILDSAIAGGGVAVILLPILALAKMVEQIRLTTLSVTTKEK